MTPITDKHEMYRRLNSGQLGHTLGAYETKEKGMTALMPSFGTGEDVWAIRYTQAGSKTKFNLIAEQAWEGVKNLPDFSFNLSPMLSNPHRVCYGHLLDGIGGWELTYSPDPKPCKLVPSLDGCSIHSKRALAARMYLNGVMDDIGWENLVRLVEEYQDHVIEFTVMSSSKFAHGPSNTIFWEVRCTTGEYERNSGWGKK